jgi:hypothetical protein
LRPVIRISAVAAEERVGAHRRRSRDRADAQADGRRHAQTAGPARRRDALRERVDGRRRRPRTEQSLQNFAQPIEAADGFEVDEIRAEPAVPNEERLGTFGPAIPALSSKELMHQIGAKGHITDHFKGEKRALIDLVDKSLVRLNVFEPD